jgi:hypothetical protein
MGKENPPWLQEARDFCGTSGIAIMGWGPNLLTVEALTDERASTIASQLARLGFKVVKNDDNTEAGMLDLSKNPEAIQSQITSLDISRRRLDEQITPVICLVCSVLIIPGLDGPNPRVPYLATLPIGLVSLGLFFRQALLIWGWKLELLPEGVHIRQKFRWSTIPWDQIHSIQTVPATPTSRQEAVVVKLDNHTSQRLGSFQCAFARRLRDRLRIELARRRGTPTV